MKKKHYIILFIISLFININVYACTTSDGCTNCANSSAETQCKKTLKTTTSCTVSDGCSNCANSSAETQCKKALGSYQTQVSCEDKCKGIQSSSAYDQCLSNCKLNSSTGSGSSSSGGSYNNGTSSGATDNNVTKQESITMKKEEVNKENCDTLFGTNTLTGKYLHDIYNILKFAVPLLLLGLSIKDFGGAIVSQDEGAKKKALNTLFQRIIISILFFVVPTILNLILKLLGFTLGIDTCIL